MREKKYTTDPALTWLTTLKSGETIDWLIDHLGVKFNDDVIIKPGYGNYQAIHIVEGGRPLHARPLSGRPGGPSRN